MVAIKGLEKFAPKDFPGFIAATVFLPGCGFRCPFCHNPDLVLRPETLADVPLDFFLAFLDARRGWLEGVCVSGGEPLMHPEVEGLLAVIKERGLLVKVDTNGSEPERLDALLRAGLVDRLAMDVKAPLERYAEVVRAKVDLSAIVRSAEVIRASGRPYLFRTTVVPGLVEAADIEKIGEWLDGSAAFQVQQFSPSGTLDPEFERLKPFSRAELMAMADLAAPHFAEVRVEGI
ncbi:MAG: anaerobic ribonucleoside-triphosphate reductase activating protein [Candidatus Aminicenantes bacterium]|nr:anaerobic ribonucleoside-triphosphate reductase activating protein [Candidatus Aminicenantes bacterium]